MLDGRSATVGVERKVGPFPIKERRNRENRARYNRYPGTEIMGSVSDRIGSGPPVLIVRKRGE